MSTEPREDPEVHDRKRRGPRSLCAVLDRHTRGNAMKCLARLLTLLACVSCGGGGDGPSSPSSAQGDFPRVSTGETNPGCTSAAPTTYMIPSLSDHVIDPNASPLEARIQVGEALRIQVEAFGCGSSANRQYESTNPAAAALTPLTGFLTGIAVLTGAAPGQTQIFATFRAGDGNVYRTTLAYCPPSPECLTPAQGNLTGGCPCANPRRIDFVRVLPR
jgi:hypothetical protein